MTICRLWGEILHRNTGGKQSEKQEYTSKDKSSLRTVSKIIHTFYINLWYFKTMASAWINKQPACNLGYFYYLQIVMKFLIKLESKIKLNNDCFS